MSSFDKLENAQAAKKECGGGEIWAYDNIGGHTSYKLIYSFDDKEYMDEQRLEMLLSPFVVNPRLIDPPIDTDTETETEQKLKLFEHHNKKIPTYMHQGIINYVEHHRSVGGFLTAIVENNLLGACYHADSINFPLIPIYCVFFWNYVPKVCWGDKKVVTEWLSHDLPNNQTS